MSKEERVYSKSEFTPRVLINNFDVSRQLAERREACLLHLLPRQRVRGGSQHEEKLLLTSGGRAAVHLVSDCQKYYCSTIIIVQLMEEEKSQAQGHLLTSSVVGNHGHLWDQGPLDGSAGGCHVAQRAEEHGARRRRSHERFYLGSGRREA